jgi:hypothetical protein
MARSEASGHPVPLDQLEPTGRPSALDNGLLLEWVNANKDSEISGELGIASTLYQMSSNTDRDFATIHRKPQGISPTEDAIAGQPYQTLSIRRRSHRSQRPRELSQA